jgi:1-phosphatidylinositol-4-phosphate 5-kinase
MYSGQWIRGKHEGHGRMDYYNASNYEGEWKSNRMHGNGTYLDPDGVKWEGT